MKFFIRQIPWTRLWHRNDPKPSRHFQYGISGAGISKAYQATKGAVRLMTKSAALELVGRNIRVNAICPGMFDTNLFETSVPKEAWEPLISLVPMKRFGRPDEIANGNCRGSASMQHRRY